MTEKVSSDWTREEAWAAQERFWEKEGADAPGGPLREWRALRMIATFEADYVAGSRRALFRTIAACGRFGIPIPPWAAKAFSEGFDLVDNMKARTWDEAFGSPWPKGMQLEKARLHRGKKLEIYNAILDEHDLIRQDGSKTPIDNELFARVGKNFGVDRDKCRVLYSSMRDMIRQSAERRKLSDRNAEKS